MPDFTWKQAQASLRTAPVLVLKFSSCKDGSELMFKKLSDMLCWLSARVLDSALTTRRRCHLYLPHRARDS